MAIQEGNIKLLKSQVMDDVPEGGGRATGTVIVDGASNSIFADISELDRAYGRVNLRKVSVGVDTPDTDGYFGANVILAEPPKDPRVSCTLFSTKDGFDHRTDAQGRVESYLVAGSEWPAFLLENHVAGQRAIQMFMRVGGELPAIGRTLLIGYNEGLPSAVTQYIRITKVTSVQRTFTYSLGGGFQDYPAVVVTCELSDALRYDFPGSPPTREFQRQSTKSVIRDTVVADAAAYAGVVPLVSSAAMGDLTLSAKSIFTQLVPSAQTEIPIVDANVAGQAVALSESASGSISYTISTVLTTTSGLSLGRSITPGSLVIATTSGNLTDTAGQLFLGSTVVGNVDYGRGAVTFQTLSASISGSKTVTFTPIGAPLRVSDTGKIPVTLESRSYNYVVTLLPMPTPGSLLVSYRSQGRWYDLRDAGSGVLKGIDPAFGVGSVSYSTGTVAVTLGALPDVGSAVLFAWNTSANYINRSSLVPQSPGVHYTVPLLEGQRLSAGSVKVEWNDGTARTATDNGKGVLTGSGTGTIDYSTGAIALIPTALPAGGQGYTITSAIAKPVATHTSIVGSGARNGDTTLTLATGVTNIKPGTLNLSWPTELAEPVAEFDSSAATIEKYFDGGFASAKDDGNGNLITPTGRNAGTINYTTGVATFQPDGPVVVKVDKYRIFYTNLIYG